ncbi:Four helix bundle protein [Candidatus Magnetomoraceae bacterium gMMP-15]
MARYEHLPIYKNAMELALYLQNTVRNFSRYNKYTIGSELRDLSRDIIKLIIRANSTTEKITVLPDLVENCEMLKVMLVFAKEAKAFASFKSFQHAGKLAASLCRQSQGWLQSSKKKSQNQLPPSKAGR